MFMRTIRSLELVENLLERSPSSSEDSDFPLEEMHAERIAQEHSRLAQYMWQGREWPFIDSLKPRVERARRELINRLEVRFAGEVVMDDDEEMKGTYTPALEHVLRSFDTIGCSGDAERSFAELVVRGVRASLFSFIYYSFASPTSLRTSLVSLTPLECYEILEQQRSNTGTSSRERYVHKRSNRSRWTQRKMLWTVLTLRRGRRVCEHSMSISIAMCI